MLVGILDRALRSRQDTARDVHGQAEKHVTKDVGWTDTRGHGILRVAVQAHQGEDVSDPNGKDGSENDSCVAIHGNEDWIRNYEKMSEATMWSGGHHWQ